MAGLLGGQLALITGAGSGIGEANARGMADGGARVLVADLKGDAAERVAAWHPRRCDRPRHGRDAAQR